MNAKPQEKCWYDSYRNNSKTIKVSIFVVGSITIRTIAHIEAAWCSLKSCIAVVV